MEGSSTLDRLGLEGLLLFVYSNLFTSGSISTSSSEIQVVKEKEKENLQPLKHVNEEEDNESKLLLPNILFTNFIATINPMKHHRNFL